MQVFKVFMKIAKKRLPTASIYFFIFAVILVIMANNSSSINGFSSNELNICITDLDGSAASAELAEFIETKHNIKKMDTDEESIQDALYYQNIDYALTINEGFEEKLAAGETDGLFENIKRSGTYDGVFLDNQLTQYISSVSMYMASGLEPAEACKAASEAAQEEVEVSVETFGNGNYDDETYIMYFIQYLAYIFLAILVAGLTPVLTKLNKKDIRRRIDCSSLPVSKKTFQIALATVTVVLGVWLIFMILGAVVYGEILFCRRGFLGILNSLVFIIVAAGITMLVSQFDLNDNTANMVSNTVSLGMAFLCGVFVPQDMLGSGVLTAAKFLPAYWYIRANNMLFGNSDETYTLGNYLSYLGIELLFAAALFSVVMALSKAKMKTDE